MSQHVADPAQAPASVQLSRVQTIRYSSGFFIFSLFWMMALMIIAAVLLPQRLTEIAPDDKVAISGVLNSVTALVSLVSNLVVGNLSDRTRSIFGRRTPWIASGGLVGGVSLFAIGILPNAWSIGVAYCLAMVGLNMMIAPAVAALSDRVPETSRGTMSAFFAAGSLAGSSLGTLVGAMFITAQLPGYIVAGVVMGISGIVTVILWPKEASSKDLPAASTDLRSILTSFRPPRNAPDFWNAFIGRSLLIFAYYMVLNYQLYILQDYIGLSTEDSAATIATMSVVLLVVSAVSALSAGPISDKIGRRKVPVVVASVLLAIGFALPWVMHNAMGMILFAAIGGFGYGMYGSVDQALNVDVLPNAEEAGKDLGILNMATTLGQMVGPIATSIIVTSLGGYGMVFPVAIVFTIVACVFIMRIRSVR
ncbi:MFS transporter [Demequina sp. NBRC 110054]|uniref:MFS transporter n=1 Tax=Demequina sp. NBRC 110054 TaxID=1570343 RepID=UPI000A03A164|nr:MFS transporter [Demequina sp. NBRC 110054]